MQRATVVSESDLEFVGIMFEFKFCSDHSLDSLRGGFEFKSSTMFINSLLVASSLLGF